MHTGYDNYWMFNRQETVPNLPGNGNLSDYMSLNRYTHILDGRQTCHLNGFAPTQKNITSQDISSYSQKTSQYDWTSMAPQSSIPYNYQTMGVHMQQKDSTVHWQNFEPRHLDSRNSVAQSLNYNNNNNNMFPKTQLLENQYNRPTTQTPRIRVRDVNSLNKIAQNSVPTNRIEERQFENNLNCGYNVNQTQQDLAQKNNVDHPKSIPSLLEVNPFQSLLQEQPAAPKPSVRQDWFPNAYSKSREQVLPSSQYQLNNIRRKEPPYGTSHSFLQELLGGVNQMDAPRSEYPQNGQAMNCRSNVPRSHGTKNCDLSLSKLLELNWNLCQPYRNPPPYSESLQRTGLPPVSQGNNLPIIEPISPPVVENNESGESSIRVTAVISLPEWCGGRVLKKISVTSNENLSTSVAESAKENVNQSDNPEVPNNDVPSAVPIDNPSGCLKVKEEPTFSLEFSPDNTTDIVIQTMKTESFGEEVESESQNGEQQASYKNTSAAASAAKTSTSGDNDNENKNNSNNNNNNNEEKIQNLDKSKNDSNVETPTGKVTVRETTDNPGEDSSHTSEIKLEVRGPNYKSKINRDKLDMLIEFINGSDKRADYAGGQNYSEKSKKQRKVKGATNAKANKSSFEKSKKSVQDTLPKVSSTVARADVTKRFSPHLLRTKSDSAKKAQIEMKKEQNPVLKNQSKEAGNTDKAKPKNDNKSQNPTSNVLWQSKEVQNNRLKNKTTKKNILEKNQKIENKSDSIEDQTQVIVTVKTEHSGKTKKLDSSTPKTYTDVTLSEKCSEVRYCLQDDQDAVENFRTCDINHNEKPKSNPTTEVVEEGLKSLPDLVSSVKEEELQNLQPQKAVEKKYKSTRIFANLKYQFCESCVTVSPTECFWMNVISGEVKCSNCFKNTNWDSTEATRKLFSDDKNLETKTNKNDCAEKFQSPDRKNATSTNSENHIDQKVVRLIPRESLDCKKSQRRHSTGKEEFRREKRKSLDENLLGERKEKRRKSEEKCGKKAQEQISEISTERSKMHSVLECSKTEKSTRKSLSKDRSQSPKKEERPKKNSTDQIRKSVKDEGPSSKGVRKVESNSEAGKNQTNSEDLWPSKLQVIEEVNEYCEDKHSRKCIELLKTEQQVEKEITKDFQTAEDGGRNHAEFKKIDSKKTWSTDLLKENQCTKVRSASCEKLQDRRKKHDEKRKSEEKSAKEHGERKKRTINGPLHYKDFVLKKLPAFYFPDTKEQVPLTETL